MPQQVSRQVLATRSTGEFVAIYTKFSISCAVLVETSTLRGGMSVTNAVPPNQEMQDLDLDLEVNDFVALVNN